VDSPCKSPDCVADRDRGSSNEEAEAPELPVFDRVRFLVGAFFANFLATGFFFEFLRGFAFFFGVAILRCAAFGFPDFLLGFFLVAIRAV